MDFFWFYKLGLLLLLFEIYNIYWKIGGKVVWFVFFVMVLVFVYVEVVAICWYYRVMYGFFDDRVFWLL